jgi:hypothetical protein
MERRGDAWVRRRQAANEGAEDFAKNISERTEQLVRRVYSREQELTKGKPRFKLATVRERLQKATAHVNIAGGCEDLVSQISGRLGYASASNRSVNYGDKFLNQ